jgi:phage shock protein A
MSTKFSIFKIFKKKLSAGLQKMVDTKDKLEYIRDHYQDEVDKYVESSEGLLTTEKALRDKVKELDEKVNGLEATAKQYAKAGDKQKAKSVFIQYNGTKHALDSAKESYKLISEQCLKVKENLSKVEINKLMLNAKIDSLKEQIEVLKLSDFDGVNFSAECDAMLKEVEDEIKMTKYRVEVKKDIKKIINNDSNDVQKLTSDDTEFEAFYEANS